MPFEGGIVGRNGAGGWHRRDVGWNGSGRAGNGWRGKVTVLTGVWGALRALRGFTKCGRLLLLPFRAERSALPQSIPSGAERSRGIWGGWLASTLDSSATLGMTGEGAARNDGGRGRSEWRGGGGRSEWQAVAPPSPYRVRGRLFSPPGFAFPRERRLGMRRKGFCGRPWAVDGGNHKGLPLRACGRIVRAVIAPTCVWPDRVTQVHRRGKCGSGQLVMLHFSTT